MCGLVAKMPIAMLVQDMAVVMEIIPTLTGSGKAMLLWLQMQSPLQVVVDNTRENVQIMRLN